jgi:hypothetical protein
MGQHPSGLDTPSTIKDDLITVLNHGSFVEYFDEIQRLMYDNSCEHGFWPPDSAGHYDSPELISAKIALMHSEASELLELVRNNSMHESSEKDPLILKGEEELADYFIRGMDFAERYGLNVAEAILRKAIYNCDRPHKHGKKI